MKVLVSGATGFIGHSLVDALLAAGHEVFALVRKLNVRLNPHATQLTLDSLDTETTHFEAFINLAGEGIADKPWNDHRKKILYESRVTLTKQIQAKLSSSPQCVISMSAIGFYGSNTNDEFDENSQPTSGFAHELCSTWESAARAFAEQKARVVIFRLGVVLGHGGALAKMRPSYLMGLGGKIGSGDQWFSWIHKHDVISAIITALADETYNGTYNLTAPYSVRQKDFAKSYAKSLNRPAIFTIPNFVMRLMFGEMSELLTMGPKVIPKRLTEAGFEFRFEKIDDALNDIASS